jgi:hypothetical protein
VNKIKWRISKCFLDDVAVLLLFKFWTFSIVSLFLNHNVSREEPWRKSKIYKSSNKITRLISDIMAVWFKQDDNIIV